MFNLKSNLFVPSEIRLDVLGCLRIVVRLASQSELYINAMKALLFLLLFSTLSWSSTAGADTAISCSKQEMEDVWLKSFQPGPLSGKERFCLAAKTKIFMHDTFVRDLAPPTPAEAEWVKGEYEYIASDGTNHMRKSKFLDHPLYLSDQLFSLSKQSDDTLQRIMDAIQLGDWNLEKRLWALFVSRLVRFDIYDYHRRLVEKGIMQSNADTLFWQGVILPNILDNGVVFNVRQK